MAAVCSISVAPTPKPLNTNRPLNFSPNFLNPKSFLPSIPSLRSAAAAAADGRKTSEDSNGVDALRRFIDLNLGNWTGSFHQFDPDGNLMHKVSTKLAASSYGEDELMSLIQTLYIKQPPSSTSISGNADEVEWAEYKIKETNIFTVDKYQQIGLFPNEKAFALRYQTAGMLETVLRQGVMGEDDDGEESPK
ncbi:hypothetical protein TEA_025125 [Camellia sinensis var. sinensis]|uniref:DUF3598 domain-containing protein n=2 Tax=Camellia sinensis TaxID=4442 RepID=A0A4S4DP58_CAMSN|nr:hypothetical protein TEA_025125 [Camellia sinensis var. sinensis]